MPYKVAPGSSSHVSQNALIGFTGFVGSNLASQFRFDALFNSRNIESIVDMSFDLLVFAGAQSKKWWANQNPDADWAGIQKAIDPLRSASAAKAVLISTIDVLPSASRNADELVDCHAAAEIGYGYNRIRLEEAFRAIFPNALIVRLPALFGPGLKKNVIFDLIHSNALETINPASKFQYYDVKRLWSDIRIVMRENLPLVHLFTEPVSTQEIIKCFFPNATIGSDPATEAHYDFRTRYGRLFGGDERYVEDRTSVLARLGAFVSAEMNKVSP
jgi:hypothetical protein